jgi:hypothetical protein
LLYVLKSVYYISSCHIFGNYSYLNMFTPADEFYNEDDGETITSSFEFSDNDDGWQIDEDEINRWKKETVHKNVMR